MEEYTSVLSEVDDEIPHLPPKDVIHRIYRDVSVKYLQPKLTNGLRYALAMIRHHTRWASGLCRGERLITVIEKLFCIILQDGSKRDLFALLVFRLISEVY